MSIQDVADSTIESQTDLEAMITQTSAASEEIAASSQTMTGSVTQLVEQMNTAKESLTTLDRHGGRSGTERTGPIKRHGGNDG